MQWSVTAPPACPDVENITTVTNPDGSVDLDWDDATGATSYIYEIQPQGTAQGTAGALVDDSSATSDATVASGVLTDGDDYTLYVQSDCGAGALGNYQSFDFSYNLPLVNDNCAGAEPLTVNAEGDCTVTYEANHANATASGAVFSCDTAGVNIDSFYTFVAPMNSTGVLIEIINGTQTGTSEIAIFDSCAGTELYCASSFSNTITEVVSGQTYTLAVWYDDFNTEGSFTICVSALAPPPSCPDVENITATTNGDGSVSLDWDDVAGATAYNYEVQPQGTAQGTAGALVDDSSATSDATVASGVLTDGEDYTVYVQSDCGAGALGNYQSLDFTYNIPQQGDTCELAIAATPQTYVGAQINAAGGADELWYVYTPSMDGSISVDSVMVELIVIY